MLKIHPLINDRSWKYQASSKISFAGLPKFQEEWCDEFKEHSFKPSVLRAGCVIAFIWCLYDFSAMGISGADSAAGDRSWILWTYSPELFCSAICFCVATVLFLNRFHQYSVSHYDRICLIVVISSYCTTLISPWMLELRRSLFQWEAAPHIEWKVDRSGFLPARTCNDSDPVASWQNYSAIVHNNAIGCELLLLSGSNLALYAFCNLCPIAFSMCPAHAATASAINFLILIAALLSAGAGGALGSGSALASAALQLVLGLSTAHVCGARRRRAQERFALSKVLPSVRGPGLVLRSVPALAMGR
jgi:hypothetical protein